MRTRGTLAVSASVVVAVIVAAASAVPVRVAAADAGVRVVSLASALAAPVPVGIGVGRVALLDVTPHRVVAVATSDPAVAHAVVRGASVLLVALRPGTTTVGVGLGGTLVASFRVTVTEEDTGLHAVRLEEGGGVPAAAAGPASSSEPARAQGDTALPPARTAAQPTGVSRFVSGLTDRQRAALAAYLRDPSLDGLAALLRALTPAQQMEFMRLVAGGSGEMTSAAGASPVVHQAAQQPRGQAAGTSAQASDPEGATPAPAGVRVSAPEGVRLTVVPTWTGPVLSLSYVLQNNTGHALRTDASQVAVSGATGDVTVRQLDLGEAGMVAPGGVETGVIVLMPAKTSEVGVRWRLGSNDGIARNIELVVSGARVVPMSDKVR